MSDKLATKFCDRPWTFLEIQEKGLYNCCPRWVNLNKIGEITPELDLSVEVYDESTGDSFRSSINIGLDFFWPDITV